MNANSDVHRMMLSNNNNNTRRGSQFRRVSFPESDMNLVTGYLEPVNPLQLAVNVNKEELLKSYENSCRYHNTTPIKYVVEQIKTFEISNDRTNALNLTNITLTTCGCESLEELLKRIQFHHIDLTNCGLTSDTAFILFEMFEYYESTLHLNISNNTNMGIRGWQACARYLKQSNALEELETRDIRLSDTEASFFLKSLEHNRHLQILKLENCNINGNSLRVLANALSSNITLKELYLADNKLGVSEATLLEKLLKTNCNLQVLDLSNNQIQDEGVDKIVQGLCTQQWIEHIEVLILWNNFLTSSCSTYISTLLGGYRGLTTLNIGCNNLYDSFIVKIKDSLIENKYMQRLGLQSTKLTCSSATELANVLKLNSSLERIDLRENCIMVHGLNDLCNSLDVNKNVIQIDLNEIPIWQETSEYQKLLSEINRKCVANKLRELVVETNETQQMCTSRPVSRASRKISLTCQTLAQEPFVLSPYLTEQKKLCGNGSSSGGKLRSPAPSPIPSPISSPVPLVTKTARFSVSRVNETECRKKSSRFTVTVIEPSSSILPLPPSSTSPKSAMCNSIGLQCNSMDDTESDGKSSTDLEKKLLNVFEPVQSSYLNGTTSMNNYSALDDGRTTSSSEESDSGFVAFDSSCADTNNISISDESVAMSPQLDLTNIANNNNDDWKQNGDDIGANVSNLCPVLVPIAEPITITNNGWQCEDN